MIKTAKPRSGRPRRDAREKIHKVRSFRVRPSLDRMLVATAEDSGRSVSEEIERSLDRSIDNAAMLSLLFDNRAVPAARLAGLIIRAVTMQSFADWATDEAQRGALKTVVNLLIDAVARDELTMDQVNQAPGQIEHKLAAYVLANPREDWIRPASAEIHQLLPRSD
jgi:hypothetical protein